MARSSARKHRVGRSAASKKSFLNLEALEARNLLASPQPDAYTTNEDAPVVTGFVTVSPYKSSWRYFEDMNRAAPNNDYPTDAELDPWHSPAHNLAAPSFGTWKTGNAPFATSNANEEPVGTFNRGTNGQVDGFTPTGGVLGPRGTIMNAGYKGANNTKVTFLARREFTLVDDPPGSLPPLFGRIQGIWDDGVRFFIDGVQVCFDNLADAAPDIVCTHSLPADAGPTTDGSVNSETTIQDLLISFADVDGQGGVLALEAGTHTFAVELHQAGTGSTDMGIEVQLGISGGAPGVADNDTPIGPFTTAVVDQPVDQANPAIDAGSVTMAADGNFTYNPTPNYTGTARFTYTITDNTGTSTPVEVLITVNPVNDPPAAVNDAYFAAEGATINATPATAASFTVVPMNATSWDVNDELENTFNEYPSDSLGRPWNAPDFDITTSVVDGIPSLWDTNLTGGFQSGTVDALSNPTAVDVPAATETTFLARHSFTLTAQEAAAAAGRFTYTCDSGCIMYINGVRAGSSPNMTGVTNPTPTSTSADAGDESLPHAVFTFPFGGTGPALVTGTNVIAIETHNDNLTSTDIGFDLMLDLIPLAGVLNNDSDPDNATITAVLDDGSQLDAAGTFTLNSDGTFTFDPDEGVSGTLQFTYHATDGTNNSNVATVTISISPDPNRPDANDDAYTVRQGGSLVTDATSTTYLPRASAGWSFFDEMTNGESPDDVMPATPIEQYPLDAQGDAWYENDFDTGSSDPAIGTWKTGAGALGAGTIDGAPIVTTVLGNDVTLGAPNVNNTVTTYLFRRLINIPDGATRNQLAIDLLADDGGILRVNGTEVFRYNMDPGPVDSTTVALGAPSEAYLPFIIDVGGLLVNGDNLFTFELHQVNTTSSDVGFDLEVRNVLGVLANDSDPQGDPVTAVLVDGPDNAAAFTLNTNGTFTYTPNAAFSGIDTFTYRANDGAFDSAPATVTITVTPTSTCGFDADLDDNGSVGRGDVAILTQNYGITTGATPAQGDINCDGQIGLLDLSELQERLTPPPSPGAPSAVVATAPVSTPAVDRALTGLDRAIQRVRPRATLAASRLEQVRASQEQSTTGTTSASRPSEQSAETNRGIRASRTARTARAHSQAIQDLFG
jgi:hypothetical protein